MSSKDGRKDPLNDASDLVVEQEKRFKSAVQDMNTVFEIGLADRQSRAGTLGSGGRGGRASIEFDVGPVGEEPVQGNQDEVGEELLFDAALGSGVKVLDDKDVLADLVQLLDAPPAMVDLHELLERITLVGSN